MNIPDPSSKEESEGKEPQPDSLEVLESEGQTSIRIKRDFFSLAPWILGLLILSPCLFLRPMFLGDSAWEGTRENILTWIGLITVDLVLILGFLAIVLKKPDFVLSSKGLNFRPSYAFGIISRFIPRDQIEDFEVVVREDTKYSEISKRWIKIKECRLNVIIKKDYSTRWIYNFSNPGNARFIGQFIKDYFQG